MRKITEAFVERWEATQELILSNAYHGAALSLSDPKKFPRTFNDWLGKPQRQITKPEQSDAEKWASFKAWVASYKPKPDELN